MSKRKKYADDFSDFWKSVDDWRKTLQENSASPLERPEEVRTKYPGRTNGYAVLNRFENAWQQCQTFNVWPGISSREAAQKMGRSPLSAIFCYVNMGLYPPPELLLAAADCYERYIDAEGDLKLEAAFFGKEVQGVGNFSARQAMRNRNLGIAMAMAALNREGLTDGEAGEEISLQLEQQGVRLSVDRVLEIANLEAPRVSRGK